LGLAPRRLQLLTLAEIGGEGNDLAAIGFLQPFQDDGGVEAAGIGQNDLLHAAMLAAAAHRRTPWNWWKEPGKSARSIGRRGASASCRGQPGRPNCGSIGPEFGLRNPRRCPC